MSIERLFHTYFGIEKRSDISDYGTTIGHDVEITPSILTRLYSAQHDSQEMMYVSSYGTT